MKTEDEFMVVGVDASAGSMRALQWAAAHVGEFGLIQPVSVWQYPWWTFSPTAAAVRLADSDSEFQAEAERGIHEALESIPADVRLEPIVTHGWTGPTLVEIGETASLIVTGTRGRSGLVAHVLGSVSLHCVNHAHGPVAVVPPEASLRKGFDRVVVGIDGSDHSVTALEWALRNTPPSTAIEAVYAWDAANVAVAAVAALSNERLALLARELAEETIDRARQATGLFEREIGARVQRGDPRTVLRDAATEDADLLVVGARGRSNVGYLLVGSVASAVVNHPVVTTVVVR